MAAKVKNYNLNVTEVRDSDFKNTFPGIFNFTVGILLTTYLCCVKSFSVFETDFSSVFTRSDVCICVRNFASLSHEILQI